MIKRAENLSEGGKLRESTMSIACPYHFKKIVENFAFHEGQSLSNFVRSSVKEKIESISGKQWKDIFELTIDQINEQRGKR